MSKITHINPEELHSSPVFSQATLVESGRTLYIGGQNGTDASGAIVAGGIAEQTSQALRNVLSVLEAAKVGRENVAKLNIYLAADADLNAGYGAAAEVWGDHPTAITVLRVAGIARPDALVEIDGIAIVD
jgi:enamine deaminase RidA (YjgF/YER057c/UK114 family)